MLLRLLRAFGDARYGFRQLVASPAYASTALLSLALGIAINTTLFSVFSALLLRPLAATDAGDVVRIGRSLRGDRSFRSATRDELEYLRRHASTLSEVFGESLETYTLTGPEGAATVSAEVVTGNYFSALGVAMASGRGFTADDDRVGGAGAAVVIGDGLWRRRFNTDGAVIGRTVTINTELFTIVGIAPQRFRGTFPGVDVDLWVTSALSGRLRARTQNDAASLQLMGRLAPGATFASVQAELDVLAARLDREDPSREPGRTFVVQEARGVHPGIAAVVRVFLSLLMAAVGLVLLIACANVASLQLARASARQSEFAVRLALGASRGRVFGQLLIESLVLAAIGATLGLLLTAGAIRAINALVLASGPTGAPIALDLAIDARVLLFTAATSIATALVFGLAPARQAMRVDVLAGLRPGPASIGGVRIRFRGALVTLQIALSAALLVAAVLATRSLRHVASVDLGFTPDDVVVAAFDIDLPGYDRARIDGFFAETLRRARRLPGVTHASLAAVVPMSGRGGRASVEVRAGDQAGVQIPYNRISDAYFATIGQRLLRGRDFAAADAAGAPPVAIVNEAMARRLWPGADAIGQLLTLDGEPAARTVVGLVADAAHTSFGGAVTPLMYLPIDQRRGFTLTLHVRRSGDSVTLIGDVARLVREVDAHVAPAQLTTMRTSMAFALFPSQVARGVAAIAGIVGVLLASVGLFGLVSYLFERRVREIGIRIALGARPARVLREIAGGALVAATVGIAIGLGLAAAVARLAASWLYGVQPFDPIAFGGVGLLLTGLALAAAWSAARKGLRVDPIRALRHE